MILEISHYVIPPQELNVIYTNNNFRNFLDCY